MAAENRDRVIPSSWRVRLYFEEPVILRRVGWIEKHPHLFWCAGVTLCIIFAILLFSRTGSRSFLTTCIPICIGTLLVPLGIRAGYHVVLAWGLHLKEFIEAGQAEIERWYGGQLAVFKGSRKMELLGIAGGLLAVVAWAFAGAFDGLTLVPRLAMAALITLGGFAAGVGIINVYWLARLVWRLGEFHVRVDPHPFGILSTGTMLLQCYVIAAIIWCGFVASVSAGFVRAGCRFWSWHCRPSSSF
jgi:hypothetical protein